ncbi:MAG: hypothetical protein ABIT20_15535 [Gemmatimonadaceae bacterium]
MRRTLYAALVAVGILAFGQQASSQALGPQRQFLAIEPYYERTQLDIGDGVDKDGLNGFGARIWINLDPFHFIMNSSIALYGSHAPSQSGRQATLTTFGAEYDQFFTRRPLGGFIEPFLLVGGGGVRVRSERSPVFGRIGDALTYGSMVAGGGLRIALPNRFELRGDAKDLIIFNTKTGTNGSSRTTNNLQLQAGLGITF